MRTARAGTVAVLALAALALGTVRAEAVVLAPGDTFPVTSIAFPGGTHLDSVFYKDKKDKSLKASFGAAVLKSGTTLDFYYQVTNLSAADAINRLTGSSFLNAVTDVYWITDGGSVPCSACAGGFFVAGTQAPGEANRNATGNVVGFNFNTGFELTPGETSRVLLIRTDATLYTKGAVAVIDGGAISEDAFQPVPEPASLALLALGLLGTGAAIRRRRKF